MYYTKWHEIDENPETNSKLAGLIDSITSNGWQGYPLLVSGNLLLTGMHRYTACEIIGVKPEIYTLEIEEGDDPEYREYLIEQLSDAIDTESLYKAIRTLNEEGLVDDYALEIIKAEYDKE